MYNAFVLFHHVDLIKAKHDVRVMGRDVSILYFQITYKICEISLILQLSNYEIISFEGDDDEGNFLIGYVEFFTP